MLFCVLVLALILILFVIFYLCCYVSDEEGVEAALLALDANAAYNTLPLDILIFVLDYNNC